MSVFAVFVAGFLAGMIFGVAACAVGRMLADDLSDDLNKLDPRSPLRGSLTEPHEACDSVQNESRQP